MTSFGVSLMVFSSFVIYACLPFAIVSLARYVVLSLFMTCVLSSFLPLCMYIGSAVGMSLFM